MTRAKQRSSPAWGGQSAPDASDAGASLAIQQLKARYARFADDKYTPRRQRKPQAALDRAAWNQASCFTTDAVWDGGRRFGSRLQGREALFRFFRGGPWRFALHYYVAPMIEVKGDRARGSWRLWQIAIPEGSEEAVLFAAITREDYRREGGTWLHSAVRFEQAHFVRPTAGAALSVVAALT